jgi:NAD(P)-dependent dehydrogenase (short-subunit alcohol dehydrogenase family)
VSAPADNRDLGGKVAFVTGAASGIGRVTALAFAGRGTNVVVADIDHRANQDTVTTPRPSTGLSA